MPRQPRSVRPTYLPFHVQGQIWSAELGSHKSNCGRVRGIRFGLDYERDFAGVGGHG